MALGTAVAKGPAEGGSGAPVCLHVSELGTCVCTVHVHTRDMHVAPSLSLRLLERCTTRKLASIYTHKAARQARFVLTDRGTDVYESGLTRPVINFALVPVANAR
jgi:hypothetical protein